MAMRKRCLCKVRKSMCKRVLKSTKNMGASKLANKTRCARKAKGEKCSPKDDGLLRDSGLANRLRALGTDFSDVALKLEAAVSAEDGVFRIVSAGMMNPGKSTLLNALLGKGEVFKTADVRETTVVRSATWKDNVVLVDTPGFSSAVCEDDNEAISALRQADLVLFVHNVAIGGINKAELDVLMALEDILGESDFRKRVLFINTRSDECPNADLERNIKESATLIKENMGCVLSSYVVSPKQHLQGLETTENGNRRDGKILIDEGGVGVLSRALLLRTKKNGGRRTGAIGLIIEDLERKKLSLAARRDEKKRKIQSESTEIRKAWSKVLSDIRPFWDECRK